MQGCVDVAVLMLVVGLTDIVLEVIPAWRVCQGVSDSSKDIFGHLIGVVYSPLDELRSGCPLAVLAEGFYRHEVAAEAVSSSIEGGRLLAGAERHTHRGGHVAGSAGRWRRPSINSEPTHVANVQWKRGRHGTSRNVRDERGGAGNGSAMWWQVRRGDRAAVRWLGNGRMALASCERYEPHRVFNKSTERWRTDQRAPHGGLQL